METLFPIVTPDYIPQDLTNPPLFQGILRRYQIDVSSNLTDGASAYASYSESVGYEADRASISITYPGANSYLYIEESQKQISLGDPDYDSDLKYLEITGVKAIMSVGDEMPSGSSAYLTFQRDGLSFILQSDNLPNNELLSVAESMITKELPKPDIGNPGIWPWGEAYGRYYTNDIGFAQNETSFRIITPTYVPDIFNQQSPYIEGQVADTEADRNDTVKLLFFTAVLEESKNGTYRVNGQLEKSLSLLPVILEISEQSSPFPKQLDFPDVKFTAVPGTNISIWTQDILDMQIGGVTFKQGDIHISINFSDIALDEIIKVIESMVD